ncbi:MAG: DNA-3-methyladenine glycosylase [Candidatus Margulisbacteria bacterium]|nr:DNA-3-methyladenine glycosylase [Candidatus Margulisiibacteriota bacterium]
MLERYFFERPVLKVARDLLGKYLVRRYRGKVTAYMITEVEAYDGPKDKACHASRGRTERNKVMFGEAGHFYVYFVYGMHWMLNIVTGKPGYPAAVLIRGVEGVNGPARVCKKLHINKKLNGKLAAHKSGLWFEDGGIKIPAEKIKRTPRIGVAYAKEWAMKPYRFVFD